MLYKTLHQEGPVKQKDLENIFALSDLNWLSKNFKLHHNMFLVPFVMNNLLFFSSFQQIHTVHERSQLRFRYLFIWQHCSHRLLCCLLKGKHEPLRREENVPKKRPPRQYGHVKSLYALLAPAYNAFRCTWNAALLNRSVSLLINTKHWTICAAYGTGIMQILPLCTSWKASQKWMLGFFFIHLDMWRWDI